MKWLLVINCAGQAMVLFLFLIFPITTFSIYAFSITAVIHVFIDEQPEARLRLGQPKTQ